MPARAPGDRTPEYYQPRQRQARPVDGILANLIDAIIAWCRADRPHQALGYRTPDETHAASRSDAA